MAVSIVRSKIVSAAAGVNPSATINAVAAGNTLISFAIESGPILPALPTDSSGDLFAFISQIAQGNLNAAITFSYCLRSAGGNETVTCQTHAGSNLVVAELSGVATPLQTTNSHGLTVFVPPIPDGSMTAQAFGSSAGGTVSTSNATGGLVLALCVAAGSPTVAFTGTGWTAAGAGSAQGLAFDLRTIAVAGPTNLTPTWTITPASSLLVMVAAFPAA